MSRYTPSNFVLRTRGSSASRDLNLRVGIGLHWVWGEQGYDFGAAINNELSYRKQDIFVR